MKQNCDFINEPTKKALFRMFLPMMAGMILNFAGYYQRPECHP